MPKYNYTSYQHHFQLQVRIKLLPWQFVKIFKERHAIVQKTLIQIASHNLSLQDISSFSDQVKGARMNLEAKKCHACLVWVEKYVWVRAARNTNVTQF